MYSLRAGCTLWLEASPVHKLGRPSYSIGINKLQFFYQKNGSFFDCKLFTSFGHQIPGSGTGHMLDSDPHWKHCASQLWLHDDKNTAPRIQHTYCCSNIKSAILYLSQAFFHIVAYLDPRLWIEKTNVLVDNETDISRNLKGLGATEIANAVRKISLAGVETAIRFFETQPRRERDPDR